MLIKQQHGATTNAKVSRITPTPIYLSRSEEEKDISSRGLLMKVGGALLSCHADSRTLSCGKMNNNTNEDDRQTVDVLSNLRYITGLSILFVPSLMSLTCCVTVLTLYYLVLPQILIRI